MAGSGLLAFDSRNSQLKLARGSSGALTIIAYKEDAKVNKLDLTSATATLTIKKNRTQATADAQLTEADGITFDADQVTNKGQLVIDFDGADTVAIASGTYHYDLEIVDSAADVYTVLLGQLVLLEDITTPATLPPDGDGNTIFAGMLLPQGNGTQDIGSPTRYIRYVYATGLRMVDRSTATVWEGFFDGDVWVWESVP